MKTKKVKDALLFTGKIVLTSYQFTRLHPNGSGTAAFFLLLFLVCPFGFKFLTYSIATIYVAAIIIKIIANSRPYDLHEATLCSSNHRECAPLKPDSDEGVSIDRKYEKTKICAQTSNRRNFKTRIEGMENLNDAEGKQASSLRFDDRRADGVLNDLDNLVDRTAKVEHRDDGMSKKKGFVARRGESSREDESVAGKGAMTLNEDKSICDFADEPKQGIEGFQSQSEANDSSEEADEEEEEEEEDALGDRSHAIEWTEEDQQSLMDLGLSELERNKRLENVIATRRVKKVAGMKIQDNLLDLDVSQPGSVPPINISKNPFGPPQLSVDALESQLLDSAPSVLLPDQNPFGMPYDSNEEKPNLAVDGISQGILASHPKDILSRHESFFPGPSITAGIDEDSGAGNSGGLSALEKRNLREPQLSRFRQESGKDQHDEQMLSKAEDPKSGLDASKNDETTSSIRDDLKISSDERLNEQRREDASVGGETERESRSGGQKDVDAHAESSTRDGNMDRQTGFRREGRGGDELSKGNDSNGSSVMNSLFGSYISLVELHKEGFLEQQRDRLAGSPETQSSWDTDLGVGNARYDVVSNGSKSSLENQSIPPTKHEEDEEGKREG